MKLFFFVKTKKIQFLKYAFSGGSGHYPVWLSDTSPTTYWCRYNQPSPTANNTYFFAASETDYSILNPGDNWFWDAKDPYLAAKDLWPVYTLGYGQGNAFILNIPPNSTGVIPDELVSEVAKLGQLIRETYGTPVASATGLPVTGMCEDISIVVDLPSQGGKFDQTVLAEDMSRGQNVAAYTLEYYTASQPGAWKPIGGGGFHGQSIGNRVVDWGLGDLQDVAALRFRCARAIDPSIPVTISQFDACLGAPLSS